MEIFTKIFYTVHVEKDNILSKEKIIKVIIGEISMEFTKSLFSKDLYGIIYMQFIPNFNISIEIVCESGIILNSSVKLTNKYKSNLFMIISSRKCVCN